MSPLRKNWEITKITFTVCTLLLRAFTTLCIYEFLWKFKPKAHYKTFWGSVVSFVFTAFLVLVVLLVSSWVVTSDFISSLNFLHLTTSNDVNVFLTLLVYALTLVVLKQTLDSQSKSAERTARMEMAKVLTEAFSHSEMFEAINYFLQEAPCLTDEQGDDNHIYIKELNKKIETKRYRYRLLTTLRHAERLYKNEKADIELFTSLITPDIVEVALFVLPKLNEFIYDEDKQVYKMVYEVFEDTRMSFLDPYYDAIESESFNDTKLLELEHIRGVLQKFKSWDNEFGDDGEKLLTVLQLAILDCIKSGEIKIFESLKKMQTEINEHQIKSNPSSKQISLKKMMKYGVKIIRFGDSHYFDWYSKLIIGEANLYYLRGFIKSHFQHNKEALVDFDKAIKLNSKHHYAYFSRAHTKSELGDNEGALKDYSTAINLDSKCTKTHNNRGVLKAKSEDYDGAIQDFSEVIKLNSNFTSAFKSRGEAYQKMAKLARANDNEAEAEELEAKAEADFTKYKQLTEKE